MNYLSRISIIFLGFRHWQIIDLLTIDKSRYFAQHRVIIVKCFMLTKTLNVWKRCSEILHFFSFVQKIGIFITIIKKKIERTFNDSQFWRFSSSLVFLANDKHMVLPQAIVLLKDVFVFFEERTRLFLTASRRLKSKSWKIYPITKDHHFLKKKYLRKETDSPVVISIMETVL